MEKCVVHVGFPKAASTCLQMEVFSKHPQINNLGRCYASIRGNYQYNQLASFYDTLRLNDLDSLGDQEARVVRHRVKNYMRARVVNVFSHEGLSDPVNPLPAKIPRNIAKVFPECSVLVIIRSQIDLLRSYYDMKRPYKNLVPTQSLKAHVSFDHWLEVLLRNPKTLLNELKYNSVLERYLSCFSKEKIQILLFEDLLHNTSAFSQKLSCFLGIDSAYTESIICAASTSHHSAPSRLEVWYRMYVEPILHAIPMGRITPTAAKNCVLRLIRHGTPLKSRCSNANRHRINEFFSPDNARVREYLPQIENYGYAL